MTSKAQKKATEKYIKNNYHRITVSLKKQDDELLSKYSKLKGMTKTAFLKYCFEKEIEFMKCFENEDTNIPVLDEVSESGFEMEPDKISEIEEKKKRLARVYGVKGDIKDDEYVCPKEILKKVEEYEKEQQNKPEIVEEEKLSYKDSDIFKKFKESGKAIAAAQEVRKENAKKLPPTTCKKFGSGKTFTNEELGTY